MQLTLTIVGLGYVGLPLAYIFAKNGYVVHGFDINEERIAERQGGTDRTGELTAKELQSVDINYSADPAIIGEADVVIMAIPTPIDADKKPELGPVKAASKTVGKHLKSGAIVVHESV